MDSHPDARRDTSGRRAVSWPLACWVAVLVLIGLVQIVRAQWFDTAVFFGAALLVVLGGRIPPRGTGRLSPRTLALGAVPTGLALCLLPRHSVGMVVVITVVGLTAVVLSWPGAPAAPRPWTPALRRLAGVWIGLFVVGCLWELAQFLLGRLHPDDASYALSDLLDPVLDGAPGRILFVVVWLAGGVYLLRRGRRG